MQSEDDKKTKLFGYSLKLALGGFLMVAILSTIMVSLGDRIDMRFVLVPAWLILLAFISWGIYRKWFKK